MMKRRPTGWAHRPAGLQVGPAGLPYDMWATPYNGGSLTPYGVDFWMFRELVVPLRWFTYLKCMTVVLGVVL
jgi:hypothetical protein